MRALLRPSRLLPLALLLVALGFALSGNSSASAESSGDSTSKAITPEDQPTAAVGSGRENYYVPDTKGLPNVPDPGRYLFVQGCSTCHGSNGEGTLQAPPLIGVGAAAVDFYVSSGRMPLSQPAQQAPRKKPVYTRIQIDALAGYVASLGDGPPIPSVDVTKGNLTQGFQLYANNCAACHNSAGSGGALGQNYYAPRLSQATPTQVAEAIRVGPGAMPVFGHAVFSDDQVDSIVKYVSYLKEGSEPGGLRLGGIGPVPEGFFGWIVGLGLLLAVARWIGTRV